MVNWKAELNFLTMYTISRKSTKYKIAFVNLRIAVFDAQWSVASLVVVSNFRRLDLTIRCSRETFSTGGKPGLTRWRKPQQWIDSKFTGLSATTTLSRVLSLFVLDGFSCREAFKPRFAAGSGMDSSLKRFLTNFDDSVLCAQSLELNPPRVKSTLVISSTIWPSRKMILYIENTLC